MRCVVSDQHDTQITVDCNSKMIKIIENFLIKNNLLFRQVLHADVEQRICLQWIPSIGSTIYSTDSVHAEFWSTPYKQPVVMVSKDPDLLNSQNYLLMCNVAAANNLQALANYPLLNLALTWAANWIYIQRIGFWCINHCLVRFQAVWSI